MRRRSIQLILLTGLVGLPATTGAVDLPFTGTLEITNPLVPLTVSGSGVADFNPATGAIRIPASVFVFSGERLVGTALASRFEMEGRNSPATIWSGTTSVFAKMALDGSFRVRLNAPPATVSAVTLPLFVIGGNRSVAGTFFATTDGGALSAALRGASSWWTGPLTETGTTAATVMVRGTDLRTPGLGGRLQLVTPVVLSVFEDGVATGEPPGFARLTLDFVPESSAALLLWAGAVALRGLRLRRRR